MAKLNIPEDKKPASAPVVPPQCGWECYGQCKNGDVMSELQKQAAEIILLRYKEVGIFDPTYDKDPLPVELEIAGEIINLCMDAVIDHVSALHIDIDDKQTVMHEIESLKHE